MTQIRVRYANSVQSIGRHRKEAIAIDWLILFLDKTDYCVSREMEDRARRAIPRGMAPTMSLPSASSHQRPNPHSRVQTRWDMETSTTGLRTAGMLMTTLRTNLP